MLCFIYEACIIRRRQEPEYNWGKETENEEEVCKAGIDGRGFFGE